MIPKTIHQIWLGCPLRPDDVARSAAWKALHPGWTLILHTNLTDVSGPWDRVCPLDTTRLVNSECLSIFEEYASERWCRAAASDIARIEIIAEQGGVYLDLDVHPLRPIDSLIEPLECFLSQECGKAFPGNFIVGATAGHPAIYAAMREINRRCRELLTHNTAKKIEHTYAAHPVEHTGPDAVGAAMTKYARCVVLPYRLLSPWPGHFRWDERHLATAPAASYAIHLFNTTWGKREMQNVRQGENPWKALPIT